MAGKIEQAFAFSDVGSAHQSAPQNTPLERRAHPPEVVDSSDHSADSVVGTVPHGLSDTDREQAICRAGAAMQAWYSHYLASGNAAHLDCAYHCLGVMRTLVAGRSPAQVARMEAERGLDLPACANEGGAT